MNNPERRRYRRASVSFPVMVELDYGPTRRKVALACDICVDGIALRTRDDLPLNVPFVIHFPWEWERAFAIVRAVRRGGSLYGCQFVSLSPKVDQAIARAVEEAGGQPKPKTITTLWRQL